MTLRTRILSVREGTASGDTEEFKEKKTLSPEFESEISVLNLQEVLSLSRLWGFYLYSFQSVLKKYNSGKCG